MAKTVKSAIRQVLMDDHAGCDELLPVVVNGKCALRSKEKYSQYEMMVTVFLDRFLTQTMDAIKVSRLGNKGINHNFEWDPRIMALFVVQRQSAERGSFYQNR